jgi:signal transduction histidine kinase/FixJ family two-component response regulator
MPANQSIAYEDRIRIEQLRLLMGSLGSSALPGIAVAMLMAWTLNNGSNTSWLIGWCAIVTLSKLFDVADARRILATEITVGQSRRLVWRLIGLHAFDGAAWGSLAIATLGSASASGSIVVIAVLSGIAGNSLSLLSPVLPVFAAFCICELSAIALKAWQLHDLSYHALGIASLLYIVALIGQARNSAKAARAAIELRFDNIDLIKRLQIETKRAQAALREAEQANLAKSKFLAAASHDLRQPIHAQGLFLEVLGRTDLTPAQQNLLASARAASEASANMLHTLLDYSRIEAGVVEPQIQPFLLQPLLNKLENELAPQANTKGIVYRSRETHAALLSDPALVELILRNLISNAIRYTERGGVLVACRVHGGAAQLEVWDTGIGIPPAQQQEVFREFHQLGNPERNRQKGLGLGLAIAQGLARLLGHELALASRPQRGSVFRLGIPLANVAVVIDEPEKAIAGRLNLGAQILVIDDDEMVRAGMIRLLGDWGCQCMAAESIEEALQHARARRPDVIISDYRLREQRTGTEAIEAVRAEIGKQVPALLITGDTAPARLREALASGLPLLHKPVSPAQLYGRLAGLLTDSRQDARDVNQNMPS